jgi:hypothetical protein
MHCEFGKVAGIVTAFHAEWSMILAELSDFVRANSTACASAAHIPCGVPIAKAMFRKQPAR